MRQHWALLLLCLAACATPYQEMGLRGGVKAVRITNDTAQITAAGNAYTDEDTIQRYALRRAAEETINDGYDVFRIETDADRTRVGSTSSTILTSGRHSVLGFGYTMPIIKPGQTLLIRMSKGPAPDPLPDGMFDAREVLKYALEADQGRDHKDCTLGSAGKVVCK